MSETTTDATATTTATAAPDMSGTAVVVRAADPRLAMHHAQSWGSLVEKGIIPDPGCDAFRMLAVSAFVVVATAGAPKHLRARPAFGVER